MKFRLGRIPAHYYIFVSCLAFFLFSLQRNFSAAHDSITYLNNIAAGINLFHPHHLLYNFIARYWLLFWQHIFPAASDFIIIESLSAVFGSASVTLCYLFFRRRSDLSEVSASVASAVIVFSFGVWSYSSNIEVYAPALFFSLLVLYYITNPGLSKKHLLPIISFTVLAILFHQVHVMLLPVVILQLYKTFPGRTFLPVAASYLLPVFILTTGIYLVVAFYVEGISDLPGFFSWSTLYAHGHDYWRAPGLSSVLLAATGFVHAIFGGHFIFRLPIDVPAGSMLSGHNLADERFLVRNLDTWLSVLLLLLFITALVLISRLVIIYFQTRSYRNRQQVPIVYTLILYSCFFFFWMPENLEFWIFQSMLFWILLFTNILNPSYGNNHLIKAAAIAICLFFINYAGSVFWLQNKDNDWYYAAIQRLVPVATTKDLVISKDPWIMDDYVRRYLSSIQPAPGNSNTLDTAIGQALQRKARVFVIDAQGPNAIKLKAVDSLLNGFSERMAIFERKEPKIYVIE